MKKTLSKLTYTAALSFLTLVGPLMAADQATPLPEFQTAAQFQKQSKIYTDENAPGKATPSDGAFYTGKPYDGDHGSYLFKFRNYDARYSRWTTPDPSGFPDGANAMIFCNNAITNGVDPDGLQFLHFDGGSVTLYTGAGYQTGGTIDWGSASTSWAALSGGTGGAGAIPGLGSGLWYKVGGSMTLGGPGDPNYYSESDFTEGGIEYMGTMSIWDDYGNYPERTPSDGGTYNSYDSANDTTLSSPTDKIQYKFGLTGIHGNTITLSAGYRIHPKARHSSAGCIGILGGYIGNQSFYDFIAANPNLELLVE